MASRGNGWKGSPSILKSTENIELVPPSPSHWINTKLGFYKLDFRNLQSCTVKINDGDPIYLDAGQGFNSNIEDKIIYSFIIVEPNIDYQWIGAY